MAGHGRRPQWATLLDASGNPRGHVKGRKDLVASAAYLPEPAAVAAARKFVRDTLCSWLDAGAGTAADAAADGGLGRDAVLLTREPVTNAGGAAGPPPGSPSSWSRASVARARVRLMPNWLPMTSSGSRVPGGNACS